MAEGIFELTGPVAVELIHDRLALLGPRGQGPPEEGVDILHIEMNAHGRTTQGVGRLPTVLRKLVRQHDHGIAQNDLRMAEASVRQRQRVALDGSERPLVELQGLGPILDGEVRRHRAVPLGDGSHSAWHESSSSSGAAS
jgi:hypothetical protein